MARRPPPPYFMANAILNFHFDYWNLSLMFSQHAENKCGCRPWHVPSEDGAKMCFVLGNVCFNQASSFWCVQDDFLVLLYLYLINSLTCACTGHWRWYFILSGYGEDQGKEDLSNVQLQKWLRGVSSLKASLHFLLKLRFPFFSGKFNNSHVCLGCSGLAIPLQSTMSKPMRDSAQVSWWAKTILKYCYRLYLLMRRFSYKFFFPAPPDLLWENLNLGDNSGEAWIWREGSRMVQPRSVFMFWCCSFVSCVLQMYIMAAGGHVQWIINLNLR